MNALTNAINAEATTTNGMMTHASSLSDIVDLFFGIGAMRGKNVIPLFSKAYASDSDLAVRVALWSRDIRGGAGERKLYRDILIYMVEKDIETARKMLSKTVELGRWDDLLVLFGTALERDVLRMISKTLTEGNDARKILENIDTLSEEECSIIIGSLNI